MSSRAISPNDPESAAFAAGRRMLKRMQELIASGTSFGIESTLAGRSYIPILKKCKRAGWRITILFLWLPRVGDAIERVARRVKEGGHGIPADVIQRRYFAGASNFVKHYMPLADELEVYDNSYKRARIASRTQGSVIAIRDAKRWSKLKRAAR